MGRDHPTDPVCVYKNNKGKVRFLTGADVIAYFRFITKLVHPNILDAELDLISTHSIQVLACVLLSEAGKYGPYIKLRLR